MGICAPEGSRVPGAGVICDRRIGGKTPIGEAGLHGELSKPASVPVNRPEAAKPNRLTPMMTATAISEAKSAYSLMVDPSSRKPRAKIWPKLALLIDVWIANSRNPSSKPA